MDVLDEGGFVARSALKIDVIRLTRQLRKLNALEMEGIIATLQHSAQLVTNCFDFETKRVDTIVAIRIALFQKRIDLHICGGSAPELRVHQLANGASAGLTREDPDSVSVRIYTKSLLARAYNFCAPSPSMVTVWPSSGV
eukprot:SAG31_NODE_525_length_14489_cov_3.693815_2_plen_140_part_00